MARANTPAAAVPTLGSTTDQASRGGFFTQSNVDVVGSLQAAINDSQITISINGNEQSFTLNQAMAETLEFTVEGGGGGGVGPVGPQGPQGPQGDRGPAGSNGAQGPVGPTGQDGADATFPANNTQTFMLSDDSTVTVTIGTDGTLSITQGTAPRLPGGTAPAPQRDDVFAPAAPEIFRFTVDPGTGGGSVDNGGVVSPEVTRTTIDDDGMDVVTTIMVDTPEVTDGTDIVVTIPADDASPEGDYRVTITPTITRPDGTTEVNRRVPPATYTRFVPFFQYRTQPTSATEVTGGEASEGVWANEVEAADGSGSLFIAVEDGLLATTVTEARLNDRVNGFRVRVGVVGSPITVTDSGGQDIVYNIFRTAGVEAGNTLFF